MIANNSLFDYSHNEPDAEFETALRVLEVVDPMLIVSDILILN